MTITDYAYNVLKIWNGVVNGNISYLFSILWSGNVEHHKINKFLLRLETQSILEIGTKFMNERVAAYWKKKSRKFKSKCVDETNLLDLCLNFFFLIFTGQDQGAAWNFVRIICIFKKSLQTIFNWKVTFKNAQHFALHDKRIELISWKLITYSCNQNFKSKFKKMRSHCGST